MRPLAFLATVLTCAAAHAAGAQSAAYAAMLRGTAPPLTLMMPVEADDVATRSLLNGAAFASADFDPLSRLIARETYEPDAGLVRWTSGQVRLPPTSRGTVDSLRVSVGGVLRSPAGSLNLSRRQYDAEAYEVALTRDWPAALAYEGPGYGIDLTPHAGVGVTNLGGSAEAGATLRLMRGDNAAAQRLEAMGVQDGASFGERGRWYLFAAASGRAVGMNMLHGDAGWDRAGLSTDATSALIGDTQLGVGWRKGAMQTSFGYIHREVKGSNLLWGLDSKADSLVAFSFSIRRH